MPQGFDGVRQAAAERNAKLASGGGGKFFRLRDGESAVVRFLEQDEEVVWAWCHEVPRGDGRKPGDHIPCRDQQRKGEACPGCANQYSRRFRGWVNLIYRDAPVAKRDEQNNVVRDAMNQVIFEGRADQIFTWEAGITVFEELDGKNATYKGLTTRDFRIERRGANMNNTKYYIEPVVGEDGETRATPMSDEDRKLAEAKPDLRERATPPSLDDWGKGQTAWQAQSSSSVQHEVNPFLATRT